MRVLIRRIELNASKLLLALPLGAVLASAAIASAAGPAVPWMLATDAVGQAGAGPASSGFSTTGGPSGSTAAAPATTSVPAAALGRSRPTVADRQEVEKLLGRARQAMKDGNLELADSLVGRAEAMRVDFGVFHLGDTPKKARHDLDQRRRVARAEAKSPANQFKPSAPPSDDARHAGALLDKAADSGDPTLGRANTKISRPPSDDGAAMPGMARSEATGALSPFGRRLDAGPPPEGAVEADIREAPAMLKPVANTDPDARRRSDALVLSARRAIAQNDLRRAAALVEEAAALNVVYALHDDTPAKVDALLRRAGRSPNFAPASPKAMVGAGNTPTCSWSRPSS